jgi:endo-1,4-beta-xylanase
MIKFSWRRSISRRNTLAIGISSISTFVAVSMGKSPALSYLVDKFTTDPARTIVANQTRRFRIVGKKTLRQRAKAKGRIYGAFPEADDRKFALDPQLQSSFVRECAMMTVGCYWGIIQPGVKTFDFTGSDYFAKFAAKHQLLLRGHPLVWHDVLPSWLPGTLNNSNAEQILTTHIDTIVRRYAGKMHSWDVLNEAIDIGDKRPDGIKETLWMKSLGADYIDLAFRVAAKADPQAKLVYNDYGVEYDTREDGAKREAILKLLQRLKSQGTPIYALGIQSHLSAGRHIFDPHKFRDFLKSVADLGLKIMLTELDVTDNNLPVDFDRRDRIVAGVYEDYLSVALSEKAVISVTTWGLSDRHTWLAADKPRPDKAPVRPLPLDSNLKPKLTWNAIARAFDRAPSR